MIGATLVAMPVNVPAAFPNLLCSPIMPAKIVSVASQSRAVFAGAIECPEGRGLRTKALVLPPGAERWTRFEKDLFVLSGGSYSPDEMARRRRIPRHLATGSSTEVMGRVSVVTPSMCSRQHFHEMLWASFEAQTWKDKELIVVESYEDEPSAFLAQKAKEDSRLVHVCFQRSEGEDFSVGLKRDMTLHLASGEFIVNFDDDDIYAPTYITKMVTEMCARRLQGLTLSSWYNYFVTTGAVGYADPRKVWEEPVEDMSQEAMDDVLFGYGFSYVHRRRPALALPYPNVGFAEDAPFFLGLRKALGNEKIGLKHDTEGLCMHLVHRANSAGHMPVARDVLESELPLLDVGSIFQRYLDERANTLVLRYRSVISRCHLAVESLRSLWPAAQAQEVSAQASHALAPLPQAAQAPISASLRPPSGHRRVRSCV